MIHPVTGLLLTVLNIYSWILIVWIVLNFLIQFKIVNAYQPFVQQVNSILFKLTEPVLKYIRRYIPAIGGLDLSPLVLIIGIHFLQNLLVYYF